MRPRAGRGEEELVASAREGDRDAFEELVRGHADRLYAVLLRFLGDAEEAREATQEAFLRAWRGIGRFKGESQFFTWLYRIGINEAKRVAGRRPPQPEARLDDEAVPEPADSSQAPETRSEAHELRAALERAVRDLPAGYRATIVLRDIEGLSTREAAEIMELGEAAFKSRLHRARLTVREGLADLL